MDKRVRAGLFAGICAFAIGAPLPAGAQDPTFPTAKIEELTGLKGAWNAEEGVFKVSSPRTDVKVTVDGGPISPFQGLASWAGFAKGAKAEAMVMGDLVLFSDEVNPVMSAALDGGLAVTALHNHFFFDQPKVYFMHIGGEGSVAALAGAVRNALDQVKAIRAAAPAPADRFEGGAWPEKSALTPKFLEDALGAKGQAKDGMVKFVWGRKVKAECGCEAGKDLGVNTWAAFAGADDAAVVDGDFAVHEDELQSVLKALRKGGVAIVAIHHHMVGETPRMLFLHYWGKGKAADLAAVLKSALALASK